MTTHYAIIRLGALGDCVHVLPTLAAWHRHQPNARFVWVTSPALIPLLQTLCNTVPITFVAMHKPKGWWARFNEVRRLIQELKPLKLKGVLNLHPNALTWVLSKAISTGWVATYRKQKLSGSALHRRHLGRRHAVDDFYEPLRKYFGWPVLQEAERWPVLPVKTAESNASQQGLTLGLIVGVGNQRPNRAWPLPHWGALIQELLKPDAFEKPVTLWLIGGLDERPLAEALMQQHSSSSVVNQCGAWTLPELAENLTQCHLVIGGDTGPLHVAGSVKSNALGLFAPTAVERTGPLGTGRIQTLTPHEDRPCWPCEKSTCQNAADCLESTCMATITPEAVLKAVKALLHSKIEGA